jgi:hypothetical protein
MAFRPPANDVIQLLPVGAKLLMVREPDNPHDVDAVKVLLKDFDANGPHAYIYKCLVDMVELDTYGHLKWNMESITDPFHLGYIANSPKTGGKYASELCCWMEADKWYECELVFSASGRPMVQLEELGLEPDHAIEDGVEDEEEIED